MNLRNIIVFAVIAALMIGFVYWSSHRLEPVKAVDVERSLSGVFTKFGLTDETAVRRLITEKKLGQTRYFSTYAEYEAPSSFSWKSFGSSLRTALDPTPFRVTKSDRRTVKGYEHYFVTISRDGLNVMELKINKKRISPVPAPAKAPKKPKIAIVVDDFGYNMNNLDAFLDIEQPITLSILPNQRYSREVARKARSRGYEVILHLPLESWRSDVKEEAITIRSGMSVGDIEARLKKEFADIPGATGASNHMGSKSTEDKKLMADVLRYLKKNNLYFFDSVTSPRSVCGVIAAESGVKFAKRDRFLDNANDTASIEKQLLDLRAMAFARGSVIAICHDRKNTAAALGRVMPEMAREGIDFVYLSEMVK